MQCQICERDSPNLSCSACARHALWPLRYEMLVRASERASLEDKINEYNAAEPSDSAHSRTDALTAADGKGVKLLRAQAKEAEVTINKIMVENEKIKIEIAEGIASNLVPPFINDLS